MQRLSPLDLSLPADEQHDVLHMVRPREQIHRLSLLRRIPARSEPGQVAGEGGGVTGNVDDTGGGHLRNDGDKLLAAALARRVENDHARRFPAPAEHSRRLSRVAAEKLRVFDAVRRRVRARVFDRVLHNLHADKTFGLCRHGEADGARAAVEVKERLLPREGGIVRGDGVKPFGLVRCAGAGERGSVALLAAGVQGELRHDEQTAAELAEMQADRDPYAAGAAADLGKSLLEFDEANEKRQQNIVNDLDEKIARGDAGVKIAEERAARRQKLAGLVEEEKRAAEVERQINAMLAELQTRSDALKKTIADTEATRAALGQSDAEQLKIEHRIELAEGLTATCATLLQDLDKAIECLTMLRKIEASSQK